MHRLDLTLPSIDENLALDEALLLEAEEGGGEILRFWEWPRLAVILGSGCRLAEDVNEQACVEDGVSIARRASGGGTVLLGTGCLVYSLVLAYARSEGFREIGSSYRVVLDVVRLALASGCPGLALAGISDLAAADLKVSGNAQQRKRTHFLHHGTLLYAFDRATMGRYLRSPCKQPEYRRNRDHVEFMANIDMSVGALKERLSAAWGAATGTTHWPEARVRELVSQKYSQEEWLRRR